MDKRSVSVPPHQLLWRPKQAKWKNMGWLESPAQGGWEQFRFVNKVRLKAESEQASVPESEQEAGRESALGNWKLILNCLENHHAASSPAFDGRKKPTALILLQDLFLPPPSSETN